MSRSALQHGLTVAAVIGALATVPIVIAELQNPSDPLLEGLDWFIWCLFLLDYVVAIVLAPNRWGRARGDLLGLAIIALSFPPLGDLLSLAVIALSFPPLPDLFGLTRLGRLLRFLRLAIVLWRGRYAIRAILARRGAAYVACLTGLLTLAGGSLLTVIEPETVKGVRRLLIRAVLPSAARNPRL